MGSISNGFRRSIQQLLVSTISAAALFSSPSSWALGEVTLDTSGFLRDSAQRGNTSAFLIFGPKFESSGKVIESAVDLKAYFYLPQSASLTAEAKNLYVATSRSLMPGHQFSIGRRQHEWSVADDTWTMGLWQPRFLWDPLRPVQVGLFGAFYSFETSEFRLTAFATPMSIPERGNNQYQDNGQIVQFGPWWNPLPNQVEMKMGKKLSMIPINYTVNMPTVNEAVFRPGAAVQARFGGRTRFWGSVGYGVLPVHQIDMAVDVGLKPGMGGSDGSKVLASIYPRFLVHQLLSAEAGYKGKYWNVFGSVTGESPIGASRSIEGDWLYTPVGPSLISSFGGALTWREGLRLSASILNIIEKPAARAALSDIDIALPGRFPFTRAAQVQASWQNRTDFSYQFGWTYDMAKDGGLVSSNVFYRPGYARRPDQASLSFGIGADFISSSTGKGWIGQFVGNDRVRGSVGYAF